MLGVLATEGEQLEGAWGGCGSGRLTVILAALERGDGDGSNGTGYNVAVAVLGEL
jgi:hypothetical protein